MPMMFVEQKDYYYTMLTISEHFFEPVEEVNLSTSHLFPNRKYFKLRSTGRRKVLSCHGQINLLRQYLTLLGNV